MKYDVIFAILFLQVKYCTGEDPCLAYRHLCKVENRGSRCHSESYLCDRLLDNGWYKVIYKGNPIDMPTSCVGRSVCGTAFPIWLKDRLPDVADGITIRRACVRGLDINDCCMKEITIAMKNCSTYNVYRLNYTMACDEAYCFGKHSCGAAPDQHYRYSTGSITVTDNPSTSGITEILSNKGDDHRYDNSPECQHGISVGVTVTGCLASALCGIILTLLVLKCDIGRRRQVTLEVAEAKDCVSVCKSHLPYPKQHVVMTEKPPLTDLAI